MFFDNYKQHAEARLRPSLLWEYELSNFDWYAMKAIVFQRVIERGRLDDFYAVLNIYGLAEFREGIKIIPFLNPKDMRFVCNFFGLNKKDLVCYTQKQLRQKHWNS
jgi:hypothetical protein